MARVDSRRSLSNDHHAGNAGVTGHLTRATDSDGHGCPTRERVYSNGQKELGEQVWKSSNVKETRNKEMAVMELWAKSCEKGDSTPCLCRHVTLQGKRFKAAGEREDRPEGAKTVYPGKRQARVSLV